MDTREFREKLQISYQSTRFDDIKVEKIIEQGNSIVEKYIDDIKEYVILYEASVIMGDTKNTQYYKNKLLGKLGMVY